MLISQKHFNWEQHYFNQDELNLKQTKELFFNFVEK